MAALLAPILGCAPGPPAATGDAGGDGCGDVVRPATAACRPDAQGTVERVIDGDTLKVRLDLGFDIFTRHTLRLRAIDCPEMDTKAGQEAKAFVQSYIKEAQRIIVRSSRADKYDRYLADIFIPTGNEPNADTDIFLNNLLLEQGQAVRM